MFNAKYELDDAPIEEGCQCPACRTYSRAYIRHLLKAKEMLGMRLCVLHNLYFYNNMMEEIRAAIEAGRYKEYKRENLQEWEFRKYKKIMKSKKHLMYVYRLCMMVIVFKNSRRK